MRAVVWSLGVLIALTLHLGTLAGVLMLTTPPEAEESLAGSFVIEIAADSTTAMVKATDLPLGVLSADSAEQAPSQTAAMVPDRVEAPPIEQSAVQSEPELPSVATPEKTTAPETEQEQSKADQTAQAASTAFQSSAPSHIEAPEARTPTAPQLGLSPGEQRARLSWHRSIALHIERFKRYPASGRASGISTVVVNFAIDRAGHVFDRMIVRSSGSPVLDATALDMLQKADPLPAPPATVSGQTFKLSIPIVFKPTT